ncbi:hypothetical protein E0K89_010925 [Aquicoccus sp. SCR17]|nr:hypothetical protein [Carideicomes alvinocaridis]
MRLIAATLLACATAPLVAAPAAASGKAETCANFGEMANRAVALRTESGLEMEAAAARLAAAYEDQSADMAALAPQVAAWVWSLPEDQLGAGVGQAMEAQCKAR